MPATVVLTGDAGLSQSRKHFEVLKPAINEISRRTEIDGHLTLFASPHATDARTKMDEYHSSGSISIVKKLYFQDFLQPGCFSEFPR